MRDTVVCVCLFERECVNEKEKDIYCICTCIDRER